MGNVEGSHIWKHAHAVWKEILNTAGGRRRNVAEAPRALGGQSEKTEGWSLFSLQGFFFSIYLWILVPGAELKITKLYRVFLWHPKESV